MLTDLSAFPLTPIHDDRIEHDAFVKLIERLAAAGVDSITVLGSTGSYVYLDREERSTVIRLAIEHADGIPVFAGVGHVRTREVLRLVDDAQDAGVAGVLLAPVSYQPLTDDDVVGLFTEVSARLSVPLIVYDNPGTTRVHFTDELFARVGELPRVAAVKIPPLEGDLASATARVERLRGVLPSATTIGISGDSGAALGFAAGCDAWYSVIGGTLPEPALRITRAARSGDHACAQQQSDRLKSFWDLFARHGSYRVVAAIVELLGLATQPCLPRPVLGLTGDAREDVRAALRSLDGVKS